jgi:hypothetical protein
MDPDLLGQLHLREFALAPKLPDFPADKLELGWSVHDDAVGTFVDNYAIAK